MELKVWVLLLLLFWSNGNMLDGKAFRSLNFTAWVYTTKSESSWAICGLVILDFTNFLFKLTRLMFVEFELTEWRLFKNARFDLEFLDIFVNSLISLLALILFKPSKELSRRLFTSLVSVSSELFLELDYLIE